MSRLRDLPRCAEVRAAPARTGGSPVPSAARSRSVRTPHPSRPEPTPARPRHAATYSLRNLESMSRISPAVSRRGFLLCTIAAVLFGASAPLAARLTDDVPGFTLAGLLYLGAAIAVLPVAGRAVPSADTFRRALGRLAVA